MKSKYISMVSIIFLTISFAFGQQYKEIKEYYDNGQIMISGHKESRFKIFEPKDESDWLKTGEWKYYYENGKILMKGYFQRDEKINEWVAYYPNGKKFLKGKYQQYFTSADDFIFDSDKRHVKSIEEWISYWDDGEIANIYTFDEDGTIRTRVVNTQYEDNYTYKSGSFAKGQMALSIDYSWNWQRQPFIEIEESILNMGNFSRYGKWTEYHKDGWISAKGEYNWKTNRSNGQWILYYENGIVKTERDYKDGKKDGLEKVYHENGQLYSKAVYEDGKCNGDYSTWNDQGVLIQASNCNGDGTVDRVFYYENGNVRSKGLEIASKKEKKYLQDGNWSFYFENGKISRIEIHKMGKHLGYQEQYLKDGTQILRDGNGVYKTFNDNGIISFEAEHKNGSRDGIATWYYENGNIKQAALYKYDENSKPFGLRWEVLSSFHEDGRSRETGTLKSGNGTWVQYNEEGAITGVTNFKNGIKIE